MSSNIPYSPSYCVLSLNLYDTPGLTPHINVLFWWSCDFRLNYSNRDTSWNVLNCQSGKCIKKSPSRKCELTVWNSTIYSDFPSIRLFINFMTLTPSWTFTEWRVVSMEYLQCFMHVSRQHLPYGHLFPYFCRLTYVLIVETSFPEFVDFLDLLPWISLETFSRFLCHNCLTRFSCIYH